MSRNNGKSGGPFSSFFTGTRDRDNNEEARKDKEMERLRTENSELQEKLEEAERIYLEVINEKGKTLERLQLQLKETQEQLEWYKEQEGAGAIPPSPHIQGPPSGRDEPQEPATTQPTVKQTTDEGRQNTGTPTQDALVVLPQNEPSPGATEGAKSAALTPLSASASATGVDTGEPFPVQDTGATTGEVTGELTSVPQTPPPRTSPPIAEETVQGTTPREAPPLQPLDSLPDDATPRLTAPPFPGSDGPRQTQRIPIPTFPVIPQMSPASIETPSSIITQAPWNSEGRSENFASPPLNNEETVGITAGVPTSLEATVDSPFRETSLPTEEALDMHYTEGRQDDEEGVDCENETEEEAALENSDLSEGDFPYEGSPPSESGLALIRDGRMPLDCSPDHQENDHSDDSHEEDGDGEGRNAASPTAMTPPPSGAMVHVATQSIATAIGGGDTAPTPNRTRREPSPLLADSSSSPFAGGIDSLALPASSSTKHVSFATPPASEQSYSPLSSASASPEGPTCFVQLLQEEDGKPTPSFFLGSMVDTTGEEGTVSVRLPRNDGASEVRSFSEEKVRVLPEVFEPNTSRHYDLVPGDLVMARFSWDLEYSDTEDDSTPAPPPAPPSTPTRSSARLKGNSEVSYKVVYTSGGWYLGRVAKVQTVRDGAKILCKIDVAYDDGDGEEDIPFYLQASAEAIETRQYVDTVHLLERGSERPQWLLNEDLTKHVKVLNVRKDLEAVVVRKSSKSNNMLLYGQVVGAVMEAKIKEAKKRERLYTWDILSD